MDKENKEEEKELMTITWTDRGFKFKDSKMPMPLVAIGLVQQVLHHLTQLSLSPPPEPQSQKDV